MEYQKILNFIENKVTDRITKASKNSQQNNSKTVTNENDKERQKIIDDLQLISIIMEYQKIKK